MFKRPPKIRSRIPFRPRFISGMRQRISFKNHMFSLQHGYCYSNTGTVVLTGTITMPLKISDSLSVKSQTMTMTTTMNGTMTMSLTMYRDNYFLKSYISTPRPRPVPKTHPTPTPICRPRTRSKFRLRPTPRIRPRIRSRTRPTFNARKNTFIKYHMDFFQDLEQK